MSEYFEIAYATAAKRICLFTGTGFSIEISNGSAPSWNNLLGQICDEHIGRDGFKDTLLPTVGSRPLNLEEVAQAIQAELSKSSLCIHDEIAAQISSIKLAGAGKYTSKFFQEQKFRVVTTNYDKLAEDLAGSDATTVCPGRPIARSDSRVKVMHVHGAIDAPEKMVVTSDDYFKFMSKDTYFSRKLSTLLHENTVVILGYSLGDTNLKAFLNDHLDFVRNHKVNNSIFFVSRNNVPQELIDYYYSCYGIRVIADTSIEDFFMRLDQKAIFVGPNIESSITDLSNVLSKGYEFTDNHIRDENSFYRIVASLGASGVSLNDEAVVEMFRKIIQKKRAFTGYQNAWDQYAHLARWLIYLGSLIDVRGTSVENTFLEAVSNAISKVRKTAMSGTSWEASESWSSGWKKISSDNRALIKTTIRDNVMETGNHVHDDVWELIHTG